MKRLEKKTAAAREAEVSSAAGKADPETGSEIPDTDNVASKPEHEFDSEAVDEKKPEV